MGAFSVVVHNRIYPTPILGVMTSGGITKQRVAKVSAAAMFIIAMYCAFESVSGDVVYRAWALGAFIVGLIMLAGVWATGLPKSEDPDNDEWMTATK